jgi:hypothetical protein
MSKVTKEIFCPICKTTFTSDVRSSLSVALRNHSNRSIICKELIQQKRLRNENLSSDRAEKQPKLRDELEQFKTSRDPSLSSNAHIPFSAVEFLASFEEVPMDVPGISLPGIIYDEIVDNESDDEESPDWFMGNDNASLDNDEVVDYVDLISNLSLLDENGMPIDIGHLRDCGSDMARVQEWTMTIKKK